MSLNFNKGIITKRRKGNSADPYIGLTETHVIINATVYLSEIPDSFEKVIVIGNDIMWMEQISGVPAVNSYIVDYSTNIVTFHPSRNGLQLEFRFKGTGFCYVPSDMIYTQLDENNNVIETLWDIINYGSIAINSIGCKDFDYNGLSSDFDENGFPRLTEYKRKNGTLYQKIYFSNPDTQGRYQLVTVIMYDCDGFTIKSTSESNMLFNEN